VTDAFAQTNNIEVWEKVKNELEEKEFCVEWWRVIFVGSEWSE
jgi:hypothetical protein